VLPPDRPVQSTPQRPRASKVAGDVSRQELYKSFVEEASRLHADALVNEAVRHFETGSSVRPIAELRILSSDEVVKAAETWVTWSSETYLSPTDMLDLPSCSKDGSVAVASARRVAGITRSFTGR